MAYIPDPLRRLVIERANGYCEYCRAPLAMVVTMEIDHIWPESAGGLTNADNLCLACGHCNGLKLAYVEAEDPETGQMAPLYNPRQNWHNHFYWSEDHLTVIGKTPVGRATIIRLGMNRERMMEARRHWLVAGWNPPY